jgi:hypothetical protein
MESGQCDSCLILVVHHSSNGVFHRLTRPLIVDSPGHPTLQIGPRVFFGALNRIQIAKSWRTQDEAWRYDGHRMTHRAATLNFRGLVKAEEFAGRATSRLAYLRSSCRLTAESWQCPNRPDEWISFSVERHWVSLLGGRALHFQAAEHKSAVAFFSTRLRCSSCSPDRAAVVTLITRAGRTIKSIKRRRAQPQGATERLASLLF